jgi:hypothetical protein
LWYLEGELGLGGDGLVVEVVVGVGVEEGVAHVGVLKPHLLVVEDHLQTEARPHIAAGLQQLLVVPVLDGLRLIHEPARLVEHAPLHHADVSPLVIAMLTSAPWTMGPWVCLSRARVCVCVRAWRGRYSSKKAGWTPRVRADISRFMDCTSSGVKLPVRLLSLRF